MTTVIGSGTTLYFHRKRTSPPSVLLVTAQNNISRYENTNRPIDRRSHSQMSRPLPHMIGLHVNNLDLHDTSCSSLGWLRSSSKRTQLSPAPDVAYRNTYLDESKSIKSSQSFRSSRSPSPSQHRQTYGKTKASSKFDSKYNQNKYRTVYDYIQDSIRQVEKYRKSKHENMSSKTKRPQNDDSTLRHVLAEKKYSARTSSIQKMMSSTSPLPCDDYANPENHINYINYYRILRSTTPNQTYQN